MFNTITAATAMVLIVVLAVIMVAGTDYDYRVCLILFTLCMPRIDI